MARRGLSDKQKEFIAAYAGNATEAAIAVGYSPKGARTSGSNNMKNANIRAAIKARQAKEKSPLIMSRQERQAFWSSVARDKRQPMRDRLKASELLGKSEGDFLDRVDVSGTLTVASVMSELARRTEGES